MPNRNIETELGNINRRLPFVAFIRRPVSTDIRNPQTGRIYERPYFWRVKNKPDGTAPDTGSQGELWYLEDITANVADWKMLVFSLGTTGIISITGDAGGAVTGNIGGDLDLQGLVVATGTRAKPVFFTGTSGSNLQELEVQVSTERTGAPLNTLDVGLCSFDDTAFDVDALGYVTLIGGGVTPPTMKYDIDTNTAPGTDPTLPTALGIIGIKGAVVAAHVVPVETHARAANEFNIEVQVGSAVTGAPASKNAAGLVQFDDTAFAVDADGYVTFTGGAANPILTLTGDDAVATSPDGAGDMGLTGLAVANALNAKPVYVNGGTNTEVVEVQVATEITGAPADKNDAGLSSYDDTQFAADANGYVTLVGGANLPSIQTVTGDDAVITGPDASGNIDYTGLAVANALNAKPIYFNGGTNAEVCEVQVSTEITGAPGDKNDAGICSFDDTSFAVDADGYVTLAAGVGGGAWVYLTQSTASSSASIEFNNTYITSTYDHYVVLIEGVGTNSDNQSLRVRLSNDNGVSFETANYLSNGVAITSSGSIDHDLETSSLVLTGPQSGADADEITCHEVHIVDAASASKDTLSFSTGGGNGRNGAQTYSSGGTYQVAETIDAIQFTYTSGNLDLGVFKLYGIKDS